METKFNNKKLEVIDLVFMCQYCGESLYEVEIVKTTKPKSFKGAFLCCNDCMGIYFAPTKAYVNRLIGD